MSKVTEQIVTPVGELAWVFITGKGREDLNGNDRYVASLKLANDSAELKAIKATIKEFWDANKPKGKGLPKSNGIKVQRDKETGEETGFTLINMWTGTTFPDGKIKVIKTYNSKGIEVNLGSKSIGNGSRGSLSGVLAIYSNGPNVGVTVYLNAVQLTKFVEYSTDAGFAAQEDGEDSFTGIDNEEGFEPVDEVSSQEPPKVKL